MSDASEEARRDLPARTIEFVGNVITQPFAKLVAATAGLCVLTCRHGEFGQVIQTLSMPSASDYLAVHLDHRWFFDVIADGRSIERAHEFAAHVRTWLERSSGIIILNTVTVSQYSPVDTDLHAQVEALAAVNSVLFALARENPRVRIVDVAGIVLRMGTTAAFRERNRRVMQHPYSPAALELIVEAYSKVVRMDIVARRKVIVLDADNTLWGGILGEDGVDGVVIDQDYPGISYTLFQAQLAHLRSLGYLLTVVTKNNESDFLELFQRRSMPLSLSDFVTYRSNWNEKSENIADIAVELNLGLDAFLFIDDNPFEVEEVRNRLPGVECCLFPKHAPEAVIELLSTIESLRASRTTAEDLVKTEQYRTQAARDALKSSSASLEDYLTSLDIRIEANVNDISHIGRIAQLTNKTNQFNLTTRRYTESDIALLMRTAAVYDFRVIDRFGDMGIVGVVIIKDDEVDTFLMSCRALGRRIESAILGFVVARSGKKLRASYHSTAKNGMVASFYDDNGFGLTFSSPEEKRYLLNEGPANVGHVRFVGD